MDLGTLEDHKVLAEVDGPQIGALDGTMLFPSSLIMIQEYPNSVQQINAVLRVDINRSAGQLKTIKKLAKK